MRIGFTSGYFRQYRNFFIDFFKKKYYKDCYLRCVSFGAEKRVED